MPDAQARLAAALADRYRIEREIGAGGMATVYLAEDLKHHRQVAIKVLRPELAAMVGAERFLSEIRTTANLQHPHILPLFDSGVVTLTTDDSLTTHDSRLLFYVMPYVEGESLRERLKRDGELPVPEAVRILEEVVDALACAHGQGIVHRDIKPDNVMLSGRHALVTDFGIAKALADSQRDGDEKTPLTTIGVALGTPAYMAPEQATADPAIDHRVDIYAVGVMGYEILAGQPPFTGMNSQQLFAAQVLQRPEPISAHRPACPPALEAILMRCLEKRAADRWQTAEELRAQLEPLASSAGTTTPARTRPTKGYAPATRHRWLTPLVAGVACIGLIALAWRPLQRRLRPAPTTALEHVQLTFTGNATLPALSHDGTRVAYVTRQCDSAGRCAQNIVVQDVQGSGTSTVLRGMVAITFIRWTPDNRTLVFQGSAAADRFGAFSMPSLGGEPRWLGCCSVSMGAGDTVLISGPARGKETVAWVRWVTASDGITRDSLGIDVTPDQLFGVEELASGGLILRYLHGRGAVWLATTRAGKVTDSLPFHEPPGFAQLSPDRRALMTLMRRQGGVDEYDVVLHRVDAAGRFISSPDTVLRQLAISGGGNLTVSGGGDVQNGNLVYGYGPTELSLWAMTRTASTSMNWSQQHLVTLTGDLCSRLSNAGDRVVLCRGNPAAPDRQQLSIMPFDSGPETMLGSPQPSGDLEWSRDDRSILLFADHGEDSMAISSLDVPTGQVTPVATLKSSDLGRVLMVPGGGMLLVYLSSFRRVGIPGLPDSTFQVPASRLTGTDLSPDGRAFVLVGWKAALDSALVERVSIADGRATVLATIGAELVARPRWLTDGSILVQILETAETMRWYRIPANGGPILALGVPPRWPSTYRFSADGRHATALASSERSDIYLIRNFGELLRAK